MDPRKNNIFQKLYCREIHGSFCRRRPDLHYKAINLFGSIPRRLTFSLKNIFDGRNDQVLIGTSRCGQFLISYSYTVDYRPSVINYKYRLHWWAFHGAVPTHKVAEVQLFDCQELTHPLHVGIAQWPTVNDRLIVYGYSEELEETYLEDVAMDNRKYYITVTTLPSLHNCRDCKAVAESFDEEDMAAGWDRAVSLSCLKHGLTIHTTLDIAPPYPKFNPSTSLKVDYKIIVNTGNFLHVLHFDNIKQKKKSTEPDTIVPDEITHRTGEFLAGLTDYICPWKKSSNVPTRKTLSKSINNTWLNTIKDKANKVYAFEEPDDGFEPRFKWFKKRRLADKMYEFCSDDEDMENKCPSIKTPRVTPEIFSNRSNTRESPNSWRTPPYSSAREAPFAVPETPGDISPAYPSDGLLVHLERNRRLETNSSLGVPNPHICDSDNCDCTNKTVPQGHPVSIQDVLRCDVPRSSVEARFTYSRSSQCSIGSAGSKSNITSVTKPCDQPMSSEPDIRYLPSRTDQSSHIPHLDISVINPNLSSILAEWEADSVSSLSPRSDTLCKNDVIQSFLDLMPGMTISPRASQTSSSNENAAQRVNENAHSVKVSSPNSSSASKYSPLLVVLRTRNCNQEELQKPKEQEKVKEVVKEEVSSKVPGKPTKELDTSLRQRMISECSVRFDRIYIELDDEIISTISTDFEDDDTAFHDALPLSVHGSAYAQLQMVSRQKAERLSMDCERVFQTSLDIDNFCAKAAAVICQLEGLKFWHCSDFDVELIDVCVLNCDILGVVCMRANVEEPTANEMDNFHHRKFCAIKCVFIWNPVADQCWLEAYTPLVLRTHPQFSDTRGDDPLVEAPARSEASHLRSYLDTTSLFVLPLHPPLRTFEHRMWVQEHLNPSVEEIRDYKNLVSFVLKPKPLLWLPSLSPVRLLTVYRPSTGYTEDRTQHIAEFWD